jgi:hypothetical protein
VFKLKQVALSSFKAELDVDQLAYDNYLSLTSSDVTTKNTAAISAMKDSGEQNTVHNLVANQYAPHVLPFAAQLNQI